MSEYSAPTQFIDLAAQQGLIRSQLDEAIKKVLDHGQYIMGPEVAKLTIPTNEGEVPVRPSFALQLSYEMYIRKKAFELVKEDGHTLSSAMKMARTDTETRTFRFVTPLGVQKGHQSVGASGPTLISLSLSSLAIAMESLEIAM